MRDACSTACSPRTSSRARPAAACISRAASAVSASTTTSRTIGEVNISSRGPVCTRNPRSLQHGERALERRQVEAGHLREHRRVDRLAEDGRALEDRAVRGGEPRDARRDEPAQRLRQREVLADELHRDERPVGDGDRARLDERLQDLLDHLRVAAGALANEAHQLGRDALDAEAHGDEALRVLRAEVREIERARARRASRADGRSRRAPRARRARATAGCATSTASSTP